MSHLYFDRVWTQWKFTINRMVVWHSYLIDLEGILVSSKLAWTPMIKILFDVVSVRRVMTRIFRISIYNYINFYVSLRIMWTLNMQTAIENINLVICFWFLLDDILCSNSPYIVCYVLLQCSSWFWSQLIYFWSSSIGQKGWGAARGRF